MYISDDHIFYGSLSVALIAFVVLTASFFNDKTVQASYSERIALAAQKTDSKIKKVSFRSRLNKGNSKTKRHIAIAILKAGYNCTHMTYLKPLALSGVFEATCANNTSDSSTERYIYNLKSGFVHQL